MPHRPPTSCPPADTLAERAYAQIKQRIGDFRLLPGDRFSETELAQTVQVSRTPLRQALQRLQREGFLQVFPKSGWQVAPLDFEVFDELYDLRVLLETHAIARLCEMEDRPALAAVVPNVRGRTVLLDVGANAQCKARHLEEFAVMGNAYTRDVFHTPNPRVGLMSMGEEETKGNELTRQATGEPLTPKYFVAEIR